MTKSDKGRSDMATREFLDFADAVAIVSSMKPDDWRGLEEMLGALTDESFEEVATTFARLAALADKTRGARDRKELPSLAEPPRPRVGRGTLTAERLQGEGEPKATR